MRQIAEALDSLPDNESRTRVLRWATDFFDLKDVGVATASPAREPLVRPSKATGHKDSALSVEDLSSFFEDDPVDPDQMAVSAPAPAPEPKGGVVSMLHNFVADFQKLARDWQE